MHLPAPGHQPCLNERWSHVAAGPRKNPISPPCFDCYMGKFGELDETLRWKIWGMKSGVGLKIGKAKTTHPRAVDAVIETTEQLLMFRNQAAHRFLVGDVDLDGLHLEVRVRGYLLAFGSGFLCSLEGQVGNQNGGRTFNGELDGTSAANSATYAQMQSP